MEVDFGTIIERIYRMLNSMKRGNRKKGLYMDILTFSIHIKIIDIRKLFD